jgi:serine/threonine protein kinase
MKTYCAQCRQHLELREDAGPCCPFCGSDLSNKQVPPASTAAENPAAATLETHPQSIGRYAIIRCLGAGGVASVYEGHDAELDRSVAIKLLHPILLRSARTVELFLQEARILASLDHPGIIPIHDVGRTEEGRCYLVMKLFRESDLRRRMKEGPVPRDETANYVAQAGEALQYAHQHGLVHRDVKPANLLLDASRRIVVADFGMALRDENYGTGPAFIGTVPYMSPEQARREGHRVDARTDIYSLGVVLYELLTGRRPFTANDDAALLKRIQSEEATPPRQLDDTIPPELERVCLKAISKRASDRYGTARDFTEDLRHWQHGARRGSSPGSATAEPLRPPLRDSLSASAPTTRVVPRGLRAFDREDAGFFLRLLPGPRNRDDLPDTVAFWKTRLESTDAEQAFSIGVLYGPSGCGKSSLVKAGILPRLASHVTVLHVEASSDGTEPRLRRTLYQHFRSLPPNLELPAALEWVRRRATAAEDGQKVVIVIDQFEQWLHEAAAVSPGLLTQSLRQCDGVGLQCLLLVRDEFWLPLSRFLQDVEIRLEEGVNCALMDLFDPLHARKVLTDFGRAYGRIPEHGEPALEAQKFIERAVTELSENGKIAPVRLSLFAEMVKGKPWTPQTLQKIGGARRTGEGFLDEAFGAGAAPAVRPHATAVRAVLQALLPQVGTAIKGHMRTREELCSISGYAHQPKAFEELMRLLVSDLRLVSPAAGEIGGPAMPPGNEASSASFLPAYQLTHDYLVASIRDWLTRQLRETPRGRSMLRLALCSEWWNASPEDRHLPALLEWLGIRWLTSRRDWNEAEERLMRRANRYFMTRAGACLIAVCAGLFIAGLVYRAERDRRKQEQAAALVDRLQAIRSSQWSEVKREVHEYREQVVPTRVLHFSGGMDFPLDGGGCLTPPPIAGRFSRCLS